MNGLLEASLKKMKKTLEDVETAEDNKELIAEREEWRELSSDIDEIVNELQANAQKIGEELRELQNNNNTGLETIKKLDEYSKALQELNSYLDEQKAYRELLESYDKVIDESYSNSDYDMNKIESKKQFIENAETLSEELRKSVNSIRRIEEQSEKLNHGGKISNLCVACRNKEGKIVPIIKGRAEEYNNLVERYKQLIVILSKYTREAANFNTNDLLKESPIVEEKEDEILDSNIQKIEDSIKGNTSEEKLKELEAIKQRLLNRIDELSKNGSNTRVNVFELRLNERRLENVNLVIDKLNRELSENKVELTKENVDPLLADVGYYLLMMNGPVSYSEIKEQFNLSDERINLIINQLTIIGFFSKPDEDSFRNILMNKEQFVNCIEKLDLKIDENISENDEIFKDVLSKISEFETYLMSAEQNNNLNREELLKKYYDLKNEIESYYDKLSESKQIFCQAELEKLLDDIWKILGPKPKGPDSPDDPYAPKNSSVAMHMPYQGYNTPIHTENSNNDRPIYMNYPYDDTGKNPDYDGKAHEIEPKNIYFYKDNYYIMFYEDKSIGQSMMTILRKVNNKFYKVPLEDYSKLNDYILNNQLTPLDMSDFDFSNGIGLMPMMKADVLFGENISPTEEEELNNPSEEGNDLENRLEATRIINDLEYLNEKAKAYRFNGDCNKLYVKLISDYKGKKDSFIPEEIEKIEKLNSELLNNIKNDPKKVSIKHNAKYFIDKFNNLNDKIDNDNFTENDKSEFLVLKSEYESKYASKFTDKENEEITDLIDEIENKLDKSYESNVSKIISIVKPKNKSGLVKRIILAAAVIGGFVLAAKGCGKQNTTDVTYTVEDGNNGSIDSTSADDVSINETTDALDSKVDAIIDGIIDGTTESEEPIVSSSNDYFVDGSTDSDLDNKQDDLNSVIDDIINDNTVVDNSNDDYTVDNTVDNSADNTVDNDVDNTISGDYTTDDNNYYIGDVVNINDGSYIYDDEYDAAFDNERQNPYFTNEADRIVCGVQLQMPDGKVVNITDREDGYNAKIDYYLSQGGVVSSVLVRNSEVNADGYEGFYNIDSVSKKTMGGMSR